jgi:hypothetical protein
MAVFFVFRKRFRHFLLNHTFLLLYLLITIYFLSHWINKIKMCFFLKNMINIILLDVDIQ